MNAHKRYTAALTWRCFLSTAAGYMPLLDVTGTRAAMLEQGYHIAPGGLHAWARERVQKCLELASEQWVLFCDDARAVKCANSAVLHWSESLALVAFLGTAPIPTAHIKGEQEHD